MAGEVGDGAGEGIWSVSRQTHGDCQEVRREDAEPPRATRLAPTTHGRSAGRWGICVVTQQMMAGNHRSLCRCSPYAIVERVA